VLELRKRYAAAIVHPLELRARKGAANAGEALNLVVVKDKQKGQPAQVPEDDSSSDSSAEEEQQAMDEDELLAGVDEDDPPFGRLQHSPHDCLVEEIQEDEELAAITDIVFDEYPPPVSSRVWINKGSPRHPGKHTVHLSK